MNVLGDANILCDHAPPKMWGAHFCKPPLGNEIYYKKSVSKYMNGKRNMWH